MEKHGYTSAGESHEGAVRGGDSVPTRGDVITHSQITLQPGIPGATASRRKTRPGMKKMLDAIAVILLRRATEAGSTRRGDALRGGLKQNAAP